MTDRNRMFNASNPYQGNSKKVLCVCSAGLLRSPTAARILQVEYSYNTRAAGIDHGHALIKADAVLISWADEIVCMDEYQAAQLRSIAELGDVQAPPILVLDIPDSYGYMDVDLQEAILESYADCFRGGS